MFNRTLYPDTLPDFVVTDTGRLPTLDALNTQGDQTAMQFDVKDLNEVIPVKVPTPSENRNPHLYEHPRDYGSYSWTSHAYPGTPARTNMAQKPTRWATDLPTVTEENSY